MRIAFGEYRPDAPETDTGVLIDALNVYPEADSYRPVPGPAAYSDALESEPRGMWLFQTVAGDNDAFVAETEKIKKLSGTSWTDIGTGFTGPPADERWSAVQFGTDAIFTNVNDGLQSFDIEAGVATAAVTDSPNARFLGVFESYVFAGNQDSDPRLLSWCDTEDASNWTTGNSGSQAFKDGGHIVGLVGAAHAVIQQYAIRIAIDDPGGDIWQFDKVEQAKGAIAPDSVIPFGDTFAYLAEDGFWWNGKPIGQGRVNRTFFSQVNADRIFATVGVLDPFRPYFHWLFYTDSSPLLKRALTYNWAKDKWSPWEPNVYLASASATPGITLEQLSVLYPDLETVPYSLDSRVWQGGRPIFAVIDEDLKLAFMEGDNLEATLITGERNLIPGTRAKVLAVRPMVDTDDAVVSIRARKHMGETVSFGSEQSQQASGLCRFNAGGQFHRFKVRIPAAASWSHAMGVEIPDLGGVARQGPR